MAKHFNQLKNFFYSDKSKICGLQSWCKKCKIESDKRVRRIVDYVEYDGETFARDKRGYYLSSKPIYNGKRILLHRYVWIKHNGKIPKGYVVHHIDENKDNNDMSNFELMTNYEHSKMHGDKIFKENKEEILKRFAKSHSKKILKKIKEKNKTPRKKEWYIKQAAYIKSLGIYDKTETLICQYCGQEFKTTKLCADKTKYCSGKCADKARAESGIDDIERICVICGKPFIINKRKVRQTCSEECKYVLRAKSREKNKYQ